MAVACLCAACATPVQRIENFAQAQSMSRAQVTSGPSNLVVFRNEAARLLRSSVSGGLATLHVYLEDDDAPWIDGAPVPADPTPRDALALRLMAQDAQPSVYVTRPCAHGNATSAGCSPALWTHARYGVAVLERMAQAIRRVAADSGKPDLVLIGYGGGGTLAMLLASRVEQVVGVVTIAASLDTERRAREYAYSPLSGSLNPARQAPLPAEIAQYHVVGGRDDAAPPAVAGAALTAQPNAQLEVFEEFDHHCCWERAWSEILARFEARLHR
jgi:pimeloyl-ACP methyl ester carboxylesterase